MKLKEDGTKISFDEYLQGEETAEIKHEFVDGEAYAMVGASHKHNRLNTLLSGLLLAHLDGKSCYPVSSDQLVADKDNNRFAYYPDTLVVCGQADFFDSKERILLNPKIIIEVLSPSTEEIDRGIKSYHYRSIESLSDYLIVSHDLPRVEHFFRKKDGEWGLTTYKGMSAVLEITSISFSVPLERLYKLVL